jgi:EAL domain-containing protein (putative c-di-GMP-specific phosphodiesterase class I)
VVGIDDLLASDPTDPGLLAVLDGRAIHSLYQPVVALDGHGIVGFEALARGPAGSPWASAANLFAGAAAAGRVPELDWICRAAAVRGALAADLDPLVALFVNVEPASNRIPCPDDLAEVITIADRWPIICEITERAITGDPGGLLAAVEGLRQRRRHVALDDVGADPASQAIMPLLRPDVIKLDQTILAEPRTDYAQAVIAAVQAEADRTSAVIVAEGIETPAHVATAQAVGATLGQGFLLGRPAPLPRAVTRHAMEWPRRTSPPTSAPTPFDTAIAHVTPATVSREVMERLSRAIEDRAAATSEPTILLANFQHRDRFGSATARRYATLATRATLVGVFGQDMPAVPAPRVGGYRLRPDDPVTAEWSIILITSTGADGLFAHTTRDGTGYQAAIIDDREVVLAAARSLIERMEVVGV